MNKEQLLKHLSENHIHFADQKVQMLFSYMDYTLSENEKFNLTAITDKSEFFEKMVLDSALVLSGNDLSHKKVIDVGTGAGYPGMVLKILSPETDISLLDSTSKKIDFIKRFCSLNNIDICAYSDRAEIFSKKHVEEYDFAIARAVASLNILLEIISPLLKVGGELLAMKGPGYKEEIDNSKKALEKLNLQVTGIEEFVLPESGERRSIIHIKKLKSTPKKYPREYNQIKKQPL